MYRENLSEVISMNFNWILGGSLREMLCERLLREGKYNTVYWVNWLCFWFFNDKNHCQSIIERKGSKGGKKICSS